MSGFFTASFLTKTKSQLSSFCGKYELVVCCRGGVYVSLAILWRRSRTKELGEVVHEFCGMWKYCPGKERGMPNTSSAVEHPKSVLRVFRKESIVMGRLSTQLCMSSLVDKDAFRDR